MSSIHIASVEVSPMQALSLLVLGLGVLLQLLHFFVFSIRVFWFTKRPQQTEQPPVSVVICARNEADNIRSLLPTVLEQDYPQFEVVVVDDSSDDDTATALAELRQRYPHLYITQLAGDYVREHSKKLALTVGLKAAKHELVVLTDADCKPASTQWLAGMVAAFEPQTNFVLGYGGYLPRKGLLNLLIRFDTAAIGRRYLSFAKAGAPYMGVGRNLAYRKHLFFQNKGFGRFNHLRSGDDDLLVNTLARGRNTRVALAPELSTWSVPKTTWTDWRRQKRRHFTTAPHYRFGHKFLLGAEAFGKLLFYAGLVAATAFFPNFAYLFVAILLFRSLMLWMLTYKAHQAFGEKGIHGYAPLMDLLMPLVYIWLAWPEKKHTRKKHSWM